MSTDSSLSIKDRKRAAVEQLLLDAAEVELADGVQTASMQSIASRAGVSVGTLYNYFKDKDDLVRALTEQRRKTLVALLDEVGVQSGDAPFESQLRAFLRGLFGFFDEHRAYLRISLQLEQTPALRRRATLMADRMRKMVDRGVDDGVVSARAAPFAAEAMAGVVKAVLLARVDDKGGYVDLVEDVVYLLLHGIGR